jgi:hypothetical protein
MEQDKHDMIVRRRETMDLTITHGLNGTGQARYGRETTVKEWIRRLLTV